MIVRDDEYLDFSRVPESKGVPSFVYKICAFGILCIFAIGAACVFTGGYGHYWPANTTQRVELGNSK